MNAAARALTQGIIVTNAPVATNTFKPIKLSPQLLGTLFLVLLLVTSALGVITLSDKNRIAFGNFANLTQTRAHLQTQYGQLLLEENTWAAPARIATIAQQQLHLTQPTAQQVIIVNS